MIADWTRQI